MKLTLQQLNKIFIYTTDQKSKSVYEDWTIPKLSPDGKIYGDCEDYLMCVIFYCRIFVTIYFAVNIYTNEGHVIGKYKNQYIDNNTTEFRDEHLSIYKITRRITYFEAIFRIILSYLGFYKLINYFKRS